VIESGLLKTVKTRIHQTIKSIRTGDGAEPDLEKIKADLKKKKFLTFILNLN
jgi:hypothetical protein